MLVVPAPATDGVKVVPLTPLPEKVPPVGLPSASVIAAAFEQRLVKLPKVTVGAAFTT